MAGLDGNTTLYLPLDADFVDISSAARTFTGTNGIAITTTNPKIGLGALNVIAASTQWIYVAHDTGFDFAASDFTIDLFVYRDGVATNYGGLIGCFEDSGSYHGWVVQLGAPAADSNKVRMLFAYDSSNVVHFTTATIAATSYTHLAVERYNNTMFVYLGGVIDSTWDVTGISINGYASTNLAIGCAFGGAGNSYPFNGCEDNIRISKVARYRGTNFTPPTTAYTADAAVKRNQSMFLHVG